MNVTQVSVSIYVKQICVLEHHRPKEMFITQQELNITETQFALMHSEIFIKVAVLPHTFWSPFLKEGQG